MNRKAKIVGIFKAGRQTATRTSRRFSSRDRKDGTHRGFLSNEATSRTRQYVGTSCTARQGGQAEGMTPRSGECGLAGDELHKGMRGVPYLRSQQISGEKYGLLNLVEPGGRQS